MLPILCRMTAKNDLHNLSIYNNNNNNNHNNKQVILLSTNIPKQAYCLQIFASRLNKAMQWSILRLYSHTTFLRTILR